MPFNAIYVCIYSLFQLKYWRLEYLNTFKWFCFILKYKSFAKLSKQKIVLSHSFLDFLRIFCKVKGEFFKFGKIFPTPGEFDHHFLPQGRELDKKNCPGGRDSLTQKNFPGGCPGGCTQLELTET